MGQRTFGDWHKGKIAEAETFFVSYSYSDSDSGMTDTKTVKVMTKQGKTGAGQRVVRPIKRRYPRARVTVKMIWKEGMTPGGIYLPPGVEWIDDEVTGKGKGSL